MRWALLNSGIELFMYHGNQIVYCRVKTAKGIASFRYKGPMDIFCYVIQRQFIPSIVIIFVWALYSLTNNRNLSQYNRLWRCFVFFLALVNRAIDKRLAVLQRAHVA
jgi:hypothetical protein